MTGQGTISTFDYRKSEADADERLREFPPIAYIWHLRGEEWVEGFPLPRDLLTGLGYLWVIADRDAASDDAQSDQLKHEISRGMANAFAAGYEAGWGGQLEYIKSVREGRQESEWNFADGDDLLDWLLQGLDADPAEGSGGDADDPDPSRNRREARDA
jgi:hypothetical protein